jgi:lipopolysaccharide export system permease protein
MLAYSMPKFLAFIMPMSVMMAVLLTFLRMSGDNEIVALKACGLNPHRFIVPVLTFCLLGWLLTTFITTVGMPWGKRSYYNLSVELAKSHVDAVIKERTFIDSFQGLMLYVNQVDLQNRTMNDVFIEDQRNKTVNNIIVAPSGRITSDPDNQVIRLTLFNGTINQVALADQSAHSITFETYEMKLDMKEMMSKGIVRRKRVEQMSVPELRKYILSTKGKGKAHNKALMKFHEKFSLPFACFVLGLVAIPLGMQVKRGNRSTGTVMGILWFLTYYILLTVGWSFGESGALPPVIGMWTPNAVLGGIGIYLYMRMIKERPVRLNLPRFKRSKLSGRKPHKR